MTTAGTRGCEWYHAINREAKGRGEADNDCVAMRSRDRNVDENCPTLGASPTWTIVRFLRKRGIHTLVFSRRQKQMLASTPWHIKTFKDTI